MSDSTEPTATSPNAQDRMAKARAAKAAKKESAEALNPEGVFIGQQPGSYSLNPDPKTGMISPGRKVRWSRALIDKMYPKVKFTPMMSYPDGIKPHGITKGGYVLAAGTEVEVPSIVKDIYDSAMLAIERQSKGYPKPTAEQERAIFDAANNDTTKGRHATPVQHVGYGWDAAALAANARVQAGETVDPSSVGHEPEMGFPGGYKGKPYDGEAVKV